MSQQVLIYIFLKIWWHAATLFIYFYINRADIQYFIYTTRIEYRSCYPHCIRSVEGFLWVPCRDSNSGLLYSKVILSEPCRTLIWATPHPKVTAWVRHNRLSVLYPPAPVSGTAAPGPIHPGGNARLLLLEQSAELPLPWHRHRRVRRRRRAAGHRPAGRRGRAGGACGQRPPAPGGLSPGGGGRRSGWHCGEQHPVLTHCPGRIYLFKFDGIFLWGIREINAVLGIKEAHHFFKRGKIVPVSINVSLNLIRQPSTG